MFYYLKAFLKARHAGQGTIACGIPEGDPLSLILFSAAVDRTLGGINQYHRVVAHGNHIAIMSFSEGL